MKDTLILKQFVKIETDSVCSACCFEIWFCRVCLNIYTAECVRDLLFNHCVMSYNLTLVWGKY